MAILFLAVAVLAVLAWWRTQVHAAEIEALHARFAALAARVSAFERGPDHAVDGHVATVAPAAPAARVPLGTNSVLMGSDPKAPPAVSLGSDPGPQHVVAVGSDPVSTPRVTPTTESLEARIGSRWLLYIGIVAIVVGVSYFEKLAIDNHWINETARTIQGGIVGALLVYAGIRFVRAGYRVYGQMISGGGLAVLYVSTYAAFNLYHLINRPIAFLLMSAITALTAILADRQQSQGLAVMAVGGGFATPFLLPGDTDAEIALFTYDAILIAGTMFLTHRRVWPRLNTVSYGFTVLTVLAWAARFYAATKYLPTELFLTLFCAMFLYVLRETRRSSSPAARVATAVLWTAPAGYYVASLAVLGPHSVALLVYLVALALVGAIAGRRVGAAARFVCWIAVFVPLASWLDAHASRTWIVGGLAAVGGIYVVNLISDLERVLRDDEPIEPSALVLLHLNALAAFGCAYLLIDAVNSAATAPVAALFAAWHAGIGLALSRRRRDMSMHFAALAGSLAAIAVALQFQGAAAVAGWAAEAAAIIWLGLRERREWFRVGGLALFAWTIVRLFEIQIPDPALGHTLLLNSKAFAGLFVVALTYGLTWLHGRQPDLPARAAHVGVGLVAAKLLVLSVVATEIVDYWRIHEGGFFEPWPGLTIAAMIVGSVIIWLGLRRRQEWIRATGALVAGAGAFILLGLQFSEAPDGYVVLSSARAAAGVTAVGLLYGLAYLHQRRGDHAIGGASNVTVLVTAASAFTLSLLTSEIVAYWHMREGRFARELTLSITWAIYATVLIVTGIRRRYAPIRYFGIASFAVTIVKVFGVDMAELDRIYRVSSIIVLGVMLLASSYVYNRFRARVTGAGPAEAGRHE